MPNTPSVPITGPSTEIGASHVDSIARWCQDLVLVAGEVMGVRRRKHFDHLSKRLAGGCVDEMLCNIPTAAVTSYWNAAGPSVELVAQKMASPFGDW